MTIWLTVLFASLIGTSYGKRHSARQDDESQVFGCNTFCTPVESVYPTDFTATNCNNCLMEVLAACFDCDDSFTTDPNDRITDQETINTFVAGCNAAGFSVHPVNITGAFAACGGNTSLVGEPISLIPTGALQTNPYSCAPTPVATAAAGSGTTQPETKPNGSKGNASGGGAFFAGLMCAFILSVV